jgi:hypothetical protein
MLEKDVKEIISECFMNLVVSNNGFNMEKAQIDKFGIDAYISYSELINFNGNKEVRSEDWIGIQLKSTTEKHVRRYKDYITYRLRVSNYDKLVYYRTKGVRNPCFLVLFILPESQIEWVLLQPNHIKLKRHAFWYIPELTDKPAIGKKSTDTVTIKIPLTNRIGDDTLSMLFRKYIPV